MNIDVKNKVFRTSEIFSNNFKELFGKIFAHGNGRELADEADVNALMLCKHTGMIHIKSLFISVPTVRR